ncbi:MAG: PTS transporter subunit EIIC [Thomasclavelia sp.]|jgi:PTS system beta-glucosides-specific IIC component|nr:PTS transporter subunit EIIC [Thomasclavelia sp.]
MNYDDLAKSILDNVGGKENVKQSSHCMTRLRLILNDIEKADQEKIKDLDEIMGVVYKGGQLQLIIGPQVGDLFDAFVKLVPQSQKKEEIEVQEEKQKIKSPKDFLNVIMGSLAGCMTPLIPVLIVCGLAKAFVAVIGPQLLNIVNEKDALYILFTMVGDTGFYFLPILVGYTAAKKFGLSEMMGLLFGTILVHPTLIDMATKGTSFNVYGIPAVVQNYTTTIIPIILTVWIASYVEKFFKKHVPDTLKVFGIPVCTVIVMLPLELCVFGPLGGFLGTYICQGIISLYDMFGPLAVAVVAATFSLLVMTGMHQVLMAFLFTTFPMLGYDGFIMPAILACSWAGAGVTLCCVLKFKDKKKKSLTFGYFLTWLFGGVGEPILYGLNFPYKTPLYAGIIAGGISGLLTGIIGLKAYVLSPSNGIYGLPAFFGGPNSNYILLGIVLVASVVIGFVTMWFMKLDESLVK